jgi:glycosyltransferase involved in cell wall biosynthesis
MAAADLGVVPKRADGFGNEAFSTKILEFMACGVPVVISRTAVDSHYFDDRLVKFFAPHDERDLGSALLWAYMSAADRSARAKAGLEFAVRNSWQERVGDYRRLIDALLVGPSTAAASV